MENQNILPSGLGFEANLTSPLCQAAPVTENHGVPYIGAAIRGTATGRNDSYCDKPLSAYRSTGFQNIWQFRIAYSDGVTQLAYCLEKGVRGANGETYSSRPFSQALPQLTAAQIRRISYVMANSYPMITAAELFERAGVMSSQAPALDGNDAYAATQIAIWTFLYPKPDNQAAWRFVNCSNGQPHPKSDRLRATIAYLYNLALARSGITCDDQVELFDVDGCRELHVSSATLVDCGNGYSQIVSGRNLYGPLTVESDVAFTISVQTIFSSGSATNANIALVNQSGAPIQCPESGQEFYISLPITERGACYQVTLTTECSTASVVVMQNVTTPHLQTLGATPIVTRNNPAGSLRFLYCPPCATCPECPACPDCPACPECPECPTCPECPEPEPTECPPCPKCPPEKPCPPCEACKPCDICKPCKPCKPPKPPCEPCHLPKPCLLQPPCPPAEPIRHGCTSCFAPQCKDSYTSYTKPNKKRGYR